MDQFKATWGWIIWVALLLFGSLSLAMSMGWIQPWMPNPQCKAAICSADDSRLAGIWVGVIFMGLAGLAKTPRARSFLGLIGFTCSSLAVGWIIFSK